MRASTMRRLTTVSGFQQDRGLERTGEVNLQTWNMLMGTSPPSVRDRSLQLTAAFEGHDFTLAQGNFARRPAPHEVGGIEQ